MGSKVGQVKWFNERKGYGFITSDGGDVFVHHTRIAMLGFRTLRDGERVTYEAELTPSGLFATVVVPNDEPGNA